MQLGLVVGLIEEGSVVDYALFFGYQSPTIERLCGLISIVPLVKLEILGGEQTFHP